MEIKNNLYRCTKCLQFQPEGNFHKKNNKLGIRSVCKNCRKPARAEFYSSNKNKELEYGRNYKINNLEKRRETSRKSAAKNLLKFRIFLNSIKDIECLDCKKKYSPCVMDFDHRDFHNKIFNISEMQSRPHDILLEEISKCDIICANCHRIREHIRRHKKLSSLSKIINSYKNIACSDCNVKYPWYVMDFDHIDPSTKLFNISKPPKLDINLIIAEINKCNVICANCHRVRTFLKKSEVQI